METRTVNHHDYSTSSDSVGSGDSVACCVAAIRSASTTFSLVTYPAILLRRRFDCVSTNSFTPSLSASNSPLKRSGKRLTNSLEMRLTVSILTFPNPNSSNEDGPSASYIQHKLCCYWCCQVAEGFFRLSSFEG